MDAAIDRLLGDAGLRARLAAAREAIRAATACARAADLIEAVGPRAPSAA